MVIQHNGRKQQNKSKAARQMINGCEVFDIESNLALFNKEKVFSEIENNRDRDRVCDRGRPEAKIGHNEMVLGNGGQMHNRRIVIRKSAEGNNNDLQEYVTSTGLVVPAVSYALRKRLMTEALKHGITAEKQIETVGRSATEVVMQIIGGNIR